MRKALTFVVIALVVLTPAGQSADAAWYKKAWRGIKNTTKAVISAPFRLAGTAAGPGVKAAFDPALDGAFDRAQRLTDHAADRFRGVLDEQTSKLDKIAKERLNEFDSIMGKNLDKVDEILDDKLATFDTIATGLLDRQGKIIDDSLTRVDLILQQNISKIEQITDKSITRLELLQEDTFDRMNATLQDQVPFAASKAAHELIVPILVVFGACVLTVFVVRQVRRHQPISALKPDLTAIKTAWTNNKRFGRLAGIPSLFRPRDLIRQSAYATAAVVVVGFAGYQLSHWHFRSADNDRVANLNGAAEAFERNGDYRSAWSIYRRSWMLGETSAARYHVERARFLADFAQPSLRPDDEDLNRRLQALRDANPTSVKADGELAAARIYLSANLGLLDIGNATSGLVKEIEEYKAAFLTGNATQPRQGKLVLVTELRIALGAQDENVSGRLDKAIALARHIKTQYPSYAPAKAALINLLSIRQGSDSLRRNASSGIDGPGQHDSEIDGLAKEVAVEDPALFAMLRFQLAEIEEPDAQLMSTSDFALACRPLKDGANDDEKKAKAAAVSKAQPAIDKLNAFAESLTQEAVRIYSHPALARAETERVVARAMKRDIGMVKLFDLISEAKKGKAPDANSKLPNVDAAIAVAEKAIELDQLVVAQVWVEEAETVARGTALEEAQKTKIQAVKSRLRSRPLNAAFPTLL